jgi:hypothetical protein
MLNHRSVCPPAQCRAVAGPSWVPGRPGAGHDALGRAFPLDVAVLIDVRGGDGRPPVSRPRSCSRTCAGARPGRRRPGPHDDGLPPRPRRPRRPGRARPHPAPSHGRSGTHGVRDPRRHPAPDRPGRRGLGPRPVALLGGTRAARGERARDRRSTRAAPADGGYVALHLDGSAFVATVNAERPEHLSHDQLVDDVLSRAVGARKLDVRPQTASGSRAPVQFRSSSPRRSRWTWAGSPTGRAEWRMRAPSRPLSIRLTAWPTVYRRALQNWVRPVGVGVATRSPGRVRFT